MTQKMREYTEKDIKHLDDLEHIKKRPAMYLGEMHDPFHAAKEVIDNAVDEFMAGHVSTVFVRWDNKKGELFVADDGRGIPVGPHPKLKIPTLTAVFTKLHVGGKFERGAAYNASVGTHGVGAKATCALASEFEVYTHRDGKWWRQLMKDGIPEKKKPEPVKGPPHKDAPFKKQGTQIRVIHNPKYFDTVKIDPNNFRSRCFSISCLCPGLTVIFQNGDKKPVTFKQKHGLPNLIEHFFKEDAKEDSNLKALHKEPGLIKAKLEKDDGEIEIALQFTTGTEERPFTFVNVSYTPEAGAHYDGAVKAMTEAIMRYAKKRQKFDEEFLRSGLYIAVHAKLTDPKFKSQTKDKLLDKSGEAKHIYKAVYPAMVKFFRKNKKMALSIIEQAVEMTEARDSYQEKKRATKGLQTKKGEKGILIGKLVKATTHNDNERELFIVEGDSAFGSVKNARSAKFQEVLPLRGKIINAAKNEMGKLMQNAEIQAIVKAIGCGIKDDCNPDKARVRNKVLILTDADSDGQHIAALLMAFFAEYMGPYVEAGHVYVVDSPLFVAAHGDKRFFAHSLKKMKKKLKKLKLLGKANISRLKGHGEANVDEVREYAVNPETRRLYKMVLNGKKDYQLIKDVMGESTETRKKIIGIANA